MPSSSRPPASPGTSGVGGRLDAEEPWEDEGRRPLVFRRSTLERRDGDAWVPFEDDRRVVPFEVVEARSTGSRSTARPSTTG